MVFLLVTLIVVAFLLPGCWIAYLAITGNKGLRRSTEVVQAGWAWFTFGGADRKSVKGPTTSMTNTLRALCGVLSCSLLILSALMFYLATLSVPAGYPTYSSSSSSSSQSAASSLSHSTRQKIYYDMIATQDQNPDSNAWNQSVKEAAADYYNVPMSEINGIIREGASNSWLQPDPP